MKKRGFGFSVVVSFALSGLWAVPAQAGQLLLLANTADDTVSVWDADTWTSRAVVRVADRPYAIAVASSGRHAYIASTGLVSGTTISTMDLATMQIVDTLDLLPKTTGMVATPDGSKLYLTGYGPVDTAPITPLAAGGSVGTIEGVAVGARSANPRPAIQGGLWHYMAASPDGTTVYSGHSGLMVSPALRVTDTATDIETAVGFTGPLWSAALSPDGSQLIFGATSSKMIVDSSTYASLGTLPPAGFGALQMVVAPGGGRLFSVEIGSEEDSVEVYDLTMQAHEATLPLQLRPVGFSFQRDSALDVDLLADGSRALVLTAAALYSFDATTLVKTAESSLPWRAPRAMTLGGDSLLCGNGVEDAGEECDDGNLSDGDACDSNCTLPACGNQIVDGTEQCDDGGEDSGDGCSELCALEPAARRCQTAAAAAGSKYFSTAMKSLRKCRKKGLYTQGCLTEALVQRTLGPAANGMTFAVAAACAADSMGGLPSAGTKVSTLTDGLVETMNAVGVSLIDLGAGVVRRTDDTAVRRCQGAIAKLGYRYAFQVMPSLQACRERINAESLSLAPEDCLFETATAEVVAKESSRGRRGLEKKCTDAIVVGNGFCADTVDGLIGPAADSGCLLSVSLDEMTTALAAVYGR